MLSRAKRIKWRDARAIVNPELPLGFCQQVGFVHNQFPLAAIALSTHPYFVLVDISHAQARLVYLRFDGKQALSQLLLCHLQREEEHAEAIEQCTACDIERHCGFAVAWAGCQYNKVGLLQAACHPVKQRKAGGDASYHAALMLVVEAIKLVLVACQHIPDGGDMRELAPLADAINDLFCFEQCIRGFFVGFSGNAARTMNESAIDRLLLDNVSVVGDVARGRHSIYEARAIACASDIIELAMAL